MASRKATARRKQRKQRQKQRQKGRSKRQSKRQKQRSIRSTTRQKQRTKRQAARQKKQQTRQRQRTKRKVAKVQARSATKQAQYAAGFAPGSGFTEVLGGVAEVGGAVAGAFGVPGLEGLSGMGGFGDEPAQQMDSFAGFDEQDSPYEEEEEAGGITDEPWFFPALIGVGGLAAYMLTRKKNGAK